MLRLSKYQREGLEHTGFERFIEEVRVFLDARFPQSHGLRGPADTRAWIRDNVARAEGYGITRDRDVRRFIVLMYARGGRLEADEYSWIRDVLENEERTGRWKMDRIQDGLSADGSEH